MNKFFKHFLLAVVFIVLTFSIPFSYCADSFDTNSIDDDSISDCSYKIVDNVNMTEYNDVYYCDILGGSIVIQPTKSFKANVLSTKRCKLKINNEIIPLSPHFLYSLSLVVQDDATYLQINNDNYKLANNKFSIDFVYIGAFGNIKAEYFTTYHDKVIKVPVVDDLSISQGSAKIIDGELYLYPEPITESCDTVTQHIVYDSNFRLSYYSITNKHCVTETLSIDTDIYTVSEEYGIVSVSPTDTNATAEIIGNIIKFTAKGEYCITLTKDSYKYVINLTVNMPDINNEPNPPEPDLPPNDNEDNNNDDMIIPPTPPDTGETLPPNDGDNTPPDNEDLPPDDNTELPPDNSDNTNDNEPPTPPDEGGDIPPDNNDTDNSEPPIPPDNGEIQPPDNGENQPPDTDIDEGNSDGDASKDNTTPPTEETLPPNNDSSIIDDGLDLNINYESKIDYAKIIIVAVGAVFIIGGITTLAVIISKIKKRK